MNVMETSPIIAFFDVDETLIRTKSMFSFLRFLGQHGLAKDTEETIDRLYKLSAHGVDRSEINRLYWMSYRGLDAEDVKSAARHWLDEACGADREFLITVTVKRLRAHQQSGHRIALVSGSGIDILQPLTSLIGADYTLATRLKELNGRYTGEIVLPVMIGEGKAQAASTLAAQLKAELRNCFAYGDHISDLPLLNLVGHPVAVGEEGALGDHARGLGWPVLSTSEFSTAGAAA